MGEASPGHYGPTRTALLLLDSHTMFVRRIPGARGLEAVRVAAQMKTWAISKGIKVIHALIDIDAAPFETCKDAARFTAIVNAMGTEGSAECPELLDEIGDEITFVRRPGYASALKSPGLEEFLQQNGIKSLILCGFSTSGCVARTALAACDAEYVVSTISDACADPDEELHRVMLGKVLNNRGYVATAKEVQSGLEKAMGGD
ncbi:Isochorismatase-like protein [Aspergillus pseudoustus]|uniref:Isochorismatase-like protein n=1 Tax=Aspergillus pseudoustus TaxID=1810923 RepID=A0ABR4J3Q4_9EURO